MDNPFVFQDKEVAKEKYVGWFVHCLIASSICLRDLGVSREDIFEVIEYVDGKTEHSTYYEMKKLKDCTEMLWDAMDMENRLNDV